MSMTLFSHLQYDFYEPEFLQSTGPIETGARPKAKARGRDSISPRQFLLIFQDVKWGYHIL